MTLFSLSDLEAAAPAVYARMSPTPQYAWPLLAERVGAQIWVKHENHTPTGAFKVRGGLVYLRDLAKTGAAGIATATRGNHGQSIPFAAAPYGLPVKVWVPRGNSTEKNAAMRAWGADLHVFGGDFDEARQEAIRAAAVERLHLLPPFHPLLVKGVATYSLELFRAIEGLEVVYVPIGLGSGICSVITVRDLLGLTTEVVGVVATGADAYARSFEAGRAVETDAARTFADGMACRCPAPEAVEIINRGAARVVRVTDDEIAEAVRAYYTDTHNLAEGAGAAPLAAAIQERERIRGRKVGVILCGGNIDTEVFAEVLAGRTPKA